MQAATNLLTGIFLRKLLLAQVLQLLFQSREGGLTLFALKSQTLDFLTTSQNTAFAQKFAAFRCPASALAAELATSHRLNCAAHWQPSHPACKASGVAWSRMNLGTTPS